MKKSKLLILVSGFILCAIFLSSSLYAQDRLASNSVSLVSPEDKLHALASTRFHFITLKQFHSALFSFVDQNPDLTKTDAVLINAGLNEFLTSSERETKLLDALRKDQSVQIQFSTYELPASIEVKPLLDQPIAFQITLTKGNERHLYDVDWSGNVILQN